MHKLKECTSSAKINHICVQINLQFVYKMCTQLFALCTVQYILHNYSANIKMPTVEGQDQPHKTHVGKSSAFDELHTLPLLKYELQHCMMWTVGFGHSLQLFCSIDSIWR